jgi:hypothetical protein
VQKLPAKPNESFLVARVLRGLEHFRVRNSNPEVVTPSSFSCFSVASVSARRSDPRNSAL